ncbi:MAG TPA: hypothetical protein VEH83_09870 [Gemmatimonadales bacterium]|nr:hypothetical protein [Gemmatimonadales bacterium]
MRERKAFTLPSGGSWPRWWLFASVAAHFVVLTALVESSMSWHLGSPASRGRLVLTGAEAGDSTRRIVLYLPSAPSRRGAGEGEAPGHTAAAPAPVTVPPSAPVDSGVPPVRIGAGGRDTGVVAIARPRAGSGRGVRSVTNYTPQLGDGRPWVNPETGFGSGTATASREIRIDSAVALRMQQLADSMEKNPSPDVNADPYVSKPWTFRVGGKTYGIDSKGIHLGDFTIPTAVLAFLSTPQGNIDQARANQAYMAMRADILRAAARAQTEEDFREAVREIRARKEKEHQEQQQNQQPQPASPQPAQP